MDQINTMENQPSSNAAFTFQQMQDHGPAECQWAGCGKVFRKLAVNQKYCTQRCKARGERQRRRERLKNEEQSARMFESAATRAERAFATLENPTLEELRKLQEAMKIVKPEVGVVVTGKMPDGWEGEEWQPFVLKLDNGTWNIFWTF